MAGSGIVQTVSRAIATLHGEFINMPETVDERNTVAQSFHSIGKFPRCIGSIDYTHIRIQSPGGKDVETFRNHKGFFSINVQAKQLSQVDVEGNNEYCWNNNTY